VVTLRPVNLRWVEGAEDDPADLRAHGDVEFRIGGDVLLGPDTGKGLTVSAAALYLLRTLDRPHTRDAPVGDHLFPCCGFALYELDGEPDVAVCGCPNGEDFEVRHAPGGVVVRAADGREWSVGWPEWRAAVFAFADRVAAFYAACAPKRPSPDDAAGFRCLAREWTRRRGAPGPSEP
jgi:hypothetical protein